MAEAVIAVAMFVGCWFQGDEMRSGAVDAKLQYINMSGVPGYFLIHFSYGKSRWMDEIVAGVPDDAELMYSCSSVRKCAEAVDKLPDRVGWLAYDLESWDNSEGDDKDIQSSVAEAAYVAHSHGKKLMFIPCSRMMFDQNYWLIPILADMVDGWVVQGQWFETIGRDFSADVRMYADLIRRGNADIPVLIQLRLNRYNWHGGDGWDKYFPIATYTPVGLYSNYWLPVADAYDGVLIADYADDSNPHKEAHRPGTYWHFVLQTPAFMETTIEPPLLGAAP